MFGDRFSSSTSCSGWLHETAPGRPDQSLSCRFLKVATHPPMTLRSLFKADYQRSQISIARSPAATVTKELKSQILTRWNTLNGPQVLMLPIC